MESSQDIPRCSPQYKVSDMELHILQLTANGAPAWLIPHLLRLSKCTVDEYWKRIKRKLYARNKVHAVVIAWYMGIIK